MRPDESLAFVDQPPETRGSILNRQAMTKSQCLWLRSIVDSIFWHFPFPLIDRLVTCQFARRIVYTTGALCPFPSGIAEVRVELGLFVDGEEKIHDFTTRIAHRQQLYFATLSNNAEPR